MLATVLERTMATGGRVPHHEFLNELDKPAYDALNSSIPTYVEANNGLRLTLGGVLVLADGGHDTARMVVADCGRLLGGRSGPLGTCRIDDLNKLWAVTEIARRASLPELRTSVALTVLNDLHRFFPGVDGAAGPGFVTSVQLAVDVLHVSSLDEALESFHGWDPPQRPEQSPQPSISSGRISPDQLALLTALARAQLQVPKGKHKEFMTTSSFSGTAVVLADGATNVAIDRTDLHVLEEHGLVRLTRHQSRGDVSGFVTEAGMAFSTDAGGEQSAARVSQPAADVGTARAFEMPPPYQDVMRDGVDVAIVTVLPEEYRAVEQLLEKPTHAPGAATSPNPYAWEVGIVTTKDGGSAYSVVLALAGRPGNTSGALAVIETARRWRPRYVMLVGCGGGLGAGLSLADVVISDTIWGYEYGKIDERGFKPRPDFTYRVDQALLSAAQRLLSDARWREMAGPFLRNAPSTKAVTGPVASGDKVVDDITDAFFARVLRAWPKLRAVEMEGAGAAAAIESVTSSGTAIGFIMVRGVSDVPRHVPWNVRVRNWFAGVSAAPQTVQRDEWKQHACATAAAFAVALIGDGWPVPPRSPSLPRQTAPIATTAPARAHAAGNSSAEQPHQRRGRGWLLATGVLVIVAVLFGSTMRREDVAHSPSSPPHIASQDRSTWGARNCPPGQTVWESFAQTERFERIRSWTCVDPRTQTASGPSISWYDSGQKALEQLPTTNGETELVGYYPGGNVQFRGRYRGKRPVGWRVYLDEDGKFQRAMCYQGNTGPWLTVTSEEQVITTPCPAPLEGPQDVGPEVPLRPSESDEEPKPGADNVGACVVKEGSVEVRNSDDVAALGRNPCFTVTGNLTVHAPGLSNIMGLSGLKAVGGTLRIHESTAIAELNLPLLASVGDLVAITGNSVLKRIDLPALTTVVGGVNVDGNPALADLLLPQLRSVGGELRIRNNKALIKVSLEALATVNSLTATDNVALPTLEVPSLGVVKAGLSIEANPALATVLLKAVRSVGGVIQIDKNGLTVLAVPALASANSINVERNHALTLLQLDSLDGVSEKLMVDDNASLRRVLLPNLRSVGTGGITIRSCAVTEVALPKLTSVEANLGFYSNRALRAVDLPKVRTLGALAIASNSALATVLLSEPTSVSGNLAIIDNPNLTALTGLAAITRVDGDLTISGNEKLPTCAATAFRERLGPRLAGVGVIERNRAGCP
ncbi:MAG: hypothetical protein AB2A00_09995 [Myxococcota bacterium]